MEFEFRSPQRIIAGRGAAVEKLPGAVRDLVGERRAGMAVDALVVCSEGGRARLSAVIDALTAAVTVEVFVCNFSSFGSAEPSVELAEDCARVCASSGARVVVGIGGGSVLDVSKAAAALSVNLSFAESGDSDSAPVSALAFLEGIGEGRSLGVVALPVIAVPTTAGTGSEATKNAVLRSAAHEKKVSLRHDSMIPRVAVLDPLLVLGAPREVAASAGMDALVQLMECFCSVHTASPLTDALAREGLTRAVRSLENVVLRASSGDETVEKPSNGLLAAQEDLCVASLMSGMALANAKLGSVHGFAGTLGGMFPAAPHGKVCAALAAPCFRKNVEVLEERGAEALGAETQRQTLDRFATVAALLTNGNRDVREGATALEALVRRLEISSLSAYGVKQKHFEEIVAKSRNSSSMQGNPIKLTDAELTEILEDALGSDSRSDTPSSSGPGTVEPIDIGEKLLSASLAGNAREVAALLRGQGQSDESAARNFIRERVDFANPVRGGHTALTAACWSGSVDCVRTLIVEGGATPDVPQNSMDGVSLTPLMVAASKGSLACVRFLAAVLWCQRGGSVDPVPEAERLLDEDAEGDWSDVVLEKNESGDTALDLAREGYHDDVVAFLRTKLGASGAESSSDDEQELPEHLRHLLG